MTDFENIKFIPLTQGKFAIVDAEDYELLTQWKWHTNNCGYAARIYHGEFARLNDV